MKCVFICPATEHFCQRPRHIDEVLPKDSYLQFQLLGMCTGGDLARAGGGGGDSWTELFFPLCNAKIVSRQLTESCRAFCCIELPMAVGRYQDVHRSRWGGHDREPRSSVRPSRRGLAETVAPTRQQRDVVRDSLELGGWPLAWVFWMRTIVTAW